MLPIKLHSARGKLYMKNAVLLTVSGLVLRVLGMGFRVVIANRLGSEGMGLYQLILALYGVFISLASAGINVASTRLAAQSLARGKGMAATLRSLCCTAALFGSAAMAAQGALAPLLAHFLLHDARAELSLQILAPSLPFIAVSGALRGCFLAARRVQPNVVSQLLEQLARMAVAAAALQILAGWGAGYGCAAVLLGNTVSEIFSCGIMLVFAKGEPSFRAEENEPLHPYTGAELWGIVLPVQGSRVLASALQATESSLIPFCLTQYHGNRIQAMAEYGDLKGMALPLLFFPFSVLAALSGLLMPEITRAHTKGDTDTTRKLIRTMMVMTGVFSLVSGLAFALVGAPLATTLYGNEQVGQYVRVLAIAAPFMYFESMVDGVLKGLGEQLATFRYSLADSVLRICAVLILLPRYGMAAFLGIMVFSNGFTCTMNTVRMLRVARR